MFKSIYYEQNTKKQNKMDIYTHILADLSRSMKMCQTTTGNTFQHKFICQKIKELYENLQKNKYLTHQIESEIDELQMLVEQHVCHTCF